MEADQGLLPKLSEAEALEFARWYVTNQRWAFDYTDPSRGKWAEDKIIYVHRRQDDGPTVVIIKTPPGKFGGDGWATDAAEVWVRGDMTIFYYPADRAAHRLAGSPVRFDDNGAVTHWKHGGLELHHCGTDR